MSSPTVKTGHVALNVTDVERSSAFYRRVLGFDVLGEQVDGEQKFALLGGNGILDLALWEQSAQTFPTDRAGLHHLSFEVADVAAVQRAEATLKELGAEFFYDGIVPHGEGASSGGVFFMDPDGIRLEIYAPQGADSAPAPTQGAPTCGFF